MKFSSYLDVYCLESSQNLSVPIDKAWEFFSEPKNLSKITPRRMRFDILSKVLDKIYTGQLITYKVTVLPFVRLRWVTEISKVIDNKLFIDEQIVGPYKRWSHQHHFYETEDGTRIEDIVHFTIPFGILGKLLFHLIIKKQLTHIFTYRKLKIDSLFNAEKQL